MPAFESPGPMDQERGASNGAIVQTKAMSGNLIQLQSENSAGSGSGVEGQLASSKGQGRGMDDDTQSRMESGFGADFSGVRIHDDDRAANMNDALNAQAFTHGNDIYFNRGKIPTRIERRGSPASP